jgi:hypothetical protein
MKASRAPAERHYEKSAGGPGILIGLALNFILRLAPEIRQPNSGRKPRTEHVITIAGRATGSWVLAQNSMTGLILKRASIGRRC